MVLSPNDEEVVSSKKHTQTKLVEIDTFFRPKKIKKTILFGAAHTYMADIRYYPPSPFSRDAITIHLCKVFNGTSVLLIITTHCFNE